MKRTQHIIRHGGARGQAIVELVVSLIALMSLLLGFLLITALSRESLQNVLVARDGADKRAREGILLLDSAHSIREWNYGQDSIPFTRDDEAVTDASGGAGGIFRPELTSNEEEISFLGGKTTLPLLTGDSDLDGELNGIDFYISASEITSRKEKNASPLEEYPLANLEKTLRYLFGSSTFELIDSVYMPLNNVSVQNEF